MLFAFEKFSSISTQKISTFPEVFFTRSVRIQIIVDFPAPLTPRSAKKSHSLREKLISLRASKCLYFLLREVVFIANICMSLKIENRYKFYSD
jgi:hypothetical protein